MVIRMEKLPKLYFFAGPVLAILGLLLWGLQEANGIHGFPESFAVDSCERIYLSQEDGVHVMDGGLECAVIPAGPKSRIAVTDGTLLIAETDRRVRWVDLNSGAAFPVVKEAEDPDLAVYKRLKNRTGVCTAAGRTYRYRAHLLRYVIVLSAPGEETVLYEMPGKDAGFRLLTLLFFLVFVLTVALLLLRTYAIWKNEEAAKRAAGAPGAPVSQGSLAKRRTTP